MDDSPQLPHPPAGATEPTTLRQDLAVLGWLATSPNLPALTRDLLIDALITTTALAPLPETTAEPEGGGSANTSTLLRDIDQHLSRHPHHPDDLPTQTALAELHHLLGLARYSLLDPDGAPAARARHEQHHPCLAQLRVLQTDTAVDLALAEHRRQSSYDLTTRPRPGEHPAPRHQGPGRPRSGRSGPRNHNLLRPSPARSARRGQSSRCPITKINGARRGAIRRHPAKLRS